MGKKNIMSITAIIGNQTLKKRQGQLVRIVRIVEEDHETYQEGIQTSKPLQTHRRSKNLKEKKCCGRLAGAHTHPSSLWP